MAQWYFTKNKKAHGPVTDEQVKVLFEQGDLHVSDLLFKHGDHRWKTLTEWPEFKALASDSEFASGERHWVVLKTFRNESGPVHKQLGPFSAAEVTFMLQKGEVSFGEYAWRPGFDQWLRLGQIPEFDRRREPRPEAIPVTERPVELVVAKQITLDDVYEHVVTSEGLKQTEDLSGAEERTLIQDDIAVSADEFTQEIDPSQMEGIEKTEVIAQPKPQQRKPVRSKGSWGFRALFAGTLTAAVLLLMMQGLEIYKKRAAATPRSQQPPQRLIAEVAPVPTAPVPAAPAQSSAAPVGATQPAAAPNLEAQLQAATAGAKPSTAVAVEPPKPVVPSLNVEAVDLENRAQLRFPTTSAADQIQVWIQGKTGQIVELPSFQVALKIGRQGGALAQVDLASLNMPPGFYDVQARAGQLTALKSIFVGKQDDAFQKRLESYRKQISFKQQQERAELLTLVRTFESSLKSLQTEFLKTSQVPKKWSLFYSKWQKSFRDLKNNNLANITIQTRNQYAFPDMWLDLRVLQKSITTQAESLQNAVQTGRAPASHINAELMPRLSQLKGKVLALSGR